MQAVAATLAAFRPDVKGLLARRGLLMPTIQMIFRASNKHLKDPREYLAGKAHPTVFQGGDVDALKMVQMAHDITIDRTPPIAEITVVEEEQAVSGRDFFEPADGERLRGFFEPFRDEKLVQHALRDCQDRSQPGLPAPHGRAARRAVST